MQKINTTLEQDPEREIGSLVTIPDAYDADGGFDGSLNFSNSDKDAASPTAPQSKDRDGLRQRVIKLSNTTDDSSGGDIKADVNEDIKECDEETLTLPHSSHSFLFTEPVRSTPFVFSLVIVVISSVCLILALINYLLSGEIPNNVQGTVRIAQYLSVFIALLMEEEIPTGLCLLRRINKPYLKIMLPGVSYWRFVASSVLRITMGYLFLANLIIVLIQADAVIEIFYDVLALQFIQQLDDIAFALSKKDVLGKSLQRATMTPHFNAEFKKQKESLGLRWKMKICLKGTYFLNLALLLAAMIVISVMQGRGMFQCESITVRFGDEVWEEAIVQFPDDPRKDLPGGIEVLILAFSYFNGVYVKADRVHEGRPIYIEQKKSDHTPFDKVGGLYPGYGRLDHVEPAEIKYCGGRWVFTHHYIHMSRSEEADSWGCQHWLARSPKTDSFNLLEVDGEWQVWTGKISQAKVSAVCNECSDNSDCNLNGVCKSNGECDCRVDDGLLHLGTHCEVNVPEQCRTIVGEGYNDRWSLDASGWRDMSPDDVYQEYSRPVYTYVSGLPKELEPNKGDSVVLMYSGSRWFKVPIKGAYVAALSDFWDWQTSNHHAFWSEAYKPEVTSLISDPTINDSPVGVDFYRSGQNGRQFGRFGALHPVHNQIGWGVYRCEGYDLEACPFCSKGLSVGGDFMIPIKAGLTCQDYILYAMNATNSTPVCEKILRAEMYCCQDEAT